MPILRSLFLALLVALAFTLPATPSRAEGAGDTTVGTMPHVVYKVLPSLDDGVTWKSTSRDGSIVLVVTNGRGTSADPSFATAGAQVDVDSWQWGGGLTHTTSTERDPGETADHWHARHFKNVESALKFFPRDVPHG